MFSNCPNSPSFNYTHFLLLSLSPLSSKYMGFSKWQHLMENITVNSNIAGFSSDLIRQVEVFDNIKEVAIWNIIYTVRYSWNLIKFGLGICF